MVSNRITTTEGEYLKLYLFVSSLAINFFLEIIIITNWLSIKYFFYATPMTIRIDFLPTPGNILLWVATLCLVYITKEVAEETPSFRRVNLFLNLALIGSLILLFSVFLTVISPSAELNIGPFFSQLWFLAASIGYSLSFAGSSLALFTIVTQNKSLLRLFMVYLFSLLITVEIWSLVHWVAYPFNITSYISLAWRGAFIELQLFYLSYPLIFWLFIAFLFSWVWLPLAKFAKDKIGQRQRIRIKTFLFGSQSNLESPDEARLERLSNRKDDACHESSTSRLPLAVLLTSLFIGVFIVYYPYINPQTGLVGWDTLGYYRSLTEMVNKDFYGAVQFATTTDRPLYFLLLYLSKSLTQLPSNVIIELMQIATILVNALAIFWFVRIGEKRALVASLTAVFSLFSFNTTIAMHSGILANWFAMALGFVMFGLILKLQEQKNLKVLVVALLTLVAVFFIHYWSGIFFLLVLGCYAVLTLLKHRGRITKLVVVMGLLASVALIVLFSRDLASYFFASYGYSENWTTTEVFAGFWTKLPIFIDSWFSGALANSVMMALALIGITECFHKKTNFSRLIILWTAAGSLLSVFISPIGRNMNQWLMWRALYMIPFQVPAALGLFYLVAKLGFLRQSQSSAKGDSEGVLNAKFLVPTENKSLKVTFYLIINYGVSALLLTLEFPILGALILFNYLLLTLVIHFKIRKGDNSSILVLMFVILVALSLFNYALRTLAPLTVHRMQP